MDNAEKNTYVKKKITSALLEKLKTKELNSIAVGEITEYAQVSRNSFYRNYTQKEDILREYICQLFAALPDTSHLAPAEQMGAIFAHLEEHSNFYLLLSQRNLFFLLKDAILQICGPKPEHSNMEAYAAAFISYSIYGWIEEWFARGMQESAAEMVALLNGIGFGRQGK